MVKRKSTKGQITTNKIYTIDRLSCICIVPAHMTNSSQEDMLLPLFSVIRVTRSLSLSVYFVGRYLSLYIL
jgi:hypothetical protein